jgi:hypothetical protein
MSPHPQAIQVVTVFNEPEKAKEIIAALMKVVNHTELNRLKD